MSDCCQGIEWWDDSRLSPGVAWERSIEQAIERSKVALILVSQYCLRADFVWNFEMSRLVGRGVPISWLKIRECPWDISRKASALRSLQALVDPTAAAFSSLDGAEREAALTGITRHVVSFVGEASRSDTQSTRSAEVTLVPRHQDYTGPVSQTDPKSVSLADDLDSASKARRAASVAVFSAIHDLASEGRIVSLEEVNRHPTVIECGLARSNATSLRKTLITLLKAGLLPGVFLRPEGLLLREEHFALKTQKEVSEKHEIASAAVELIPSGAAVVLDAGSTTLALAELLADALSSQMIGGLTVVTHSPAHAVRLLEVVSSEGWTEVTAPFRLVVAGGVLRPETEACVEQAGIAGPLDAFRQAVTSHSGPSFAFVGANGVTLADGFTTADPREAQIKRAIIDLVDNPYIVADGMKLGKHWAHLFGTLEDVSLITTRPDPRRNPGGNELVDRLLDSGRHTIVGELR